MRIFSPLDIVSLAVSYLLEYRRLNKAGAYVLLLGEDILLVYKHILLREYPRVEYTLLLSFLSSLSFLRARVGCPSRESVTKCDKRWNKRDKT